MIRALMKKKKKNSSLCKMSQFYKIGKLIARKKGEGEGH
jgi:hypothetical protein